MMATLSPPHAPSATPKRWRNVRLLPPIDTYPKVIAFAQRPLGKVVLIGAFGLLMKLVSPGMWIEERYMWLFITLGAAAVSLSGRYRPLTLVFVTGALLGLVPHWYDFGVVHMSAKLEGMTASLQMDYLRLATLATCAMLTAAMLWLARTYRDRPLARHPLVLQHVAYVFLIGLASTQLLRGIPQVLLWSFIATFSAYFWYLAYALIDQRSRRPAPLIYQFGTFAPFFASTPVPMGKGASSWLSVNASSPEELAVTQLKGLKLLCWALLIKLFLLYLFRNLIYSHFGVMPLGTLFTAFQKSGEVPLPASYLSILANFPERLLVIAVAGHVIIASARLAGFRLLRNTYRPLTARTVAEFWNRYVYYFKELLANVYFYPTYLRCFKKHPRLRMAFATFMAAGVGNFFFHFMENSAFLRYGIVESLIRSQTYAFYCVLLAAGIVISQLRSSRRKPHHGWWRGSLRPMLGVAAFYCFLSIFDGTQKHVPLEQHFEFLYKVLGMDRWIRPI